MRISGSVISPPDGSKQDYGPYRVRRLVARGGMGTVYEAEHVEHGQLVALKVMERSGTDETIANQRFLREARLLRRVRHPNVVSVLDVGFAYGRPYLVMDLLEGETLSAYLAREGRLSVAKVVELFAPIAAAVGTIHDARILHRDLKLSNVLLARRDGGLEPVVVDFGISKAREDDTDGGPLTRSEGLLGTPSYLSPEQTLNAKAASPLSDEYALGVMVYECLTGERPFAGLSPYEIMHAILNAPVCPPSTFRGDIPPDLDAVVLRAISRDPTARFATVRALGCALLRFGDAAVQQRWCDELTERFDEERTEVELRAPCRSRAVSDPPALAVTSRAARAGKGSVGLGLALAALAGFSFATWRRAPPASDAAGASPSRSVLAAPPPAADISTLRPAAERGTAALATAASAPSRAVPAGAKPPRRRSQNDGATRARSKPAAPGRDEALDPFDGI